MVHRNPNFSKLEPNYLFVDIYNRQKKFQQENPNAKIISLGIGDTTEPIVPSVTEAFHNQVKALSTVEGYTGYPPFNGSSTLRKLIAKHVYNNMGIHEDEIFISDGSKPDLSRLQLLFGNNVTAAVQDPVYPAYVDGLVISGKSGDLNSQLEKYSKIEYMECTPENNFFPNLSKLKRTDIIFFCSPNNPTGVCATRKQLKELVDFAQKNKSIILFDSAYSQFVKDPKCPKSIYEIEGAHAVAIEISSFSKYLGFTGIRLGWTVCPKKLLYEDGTCLYQDWSRIMATFFNGASSISEKGAIGSFTVKGISETTNLLNYYMENAHLIKSTLQSLGFEVYGGENCPYIWTRIPGMDSWDVFQLILEKAHVIVTPGSGFGKCGKGFVRLSSFAHREHVEEAIKRLIPALTDALRNLNSNK